MHVAPPKCYIYTKFCSERDPCFAIDEKARTVELEASEDQREAEESFSQSERAFFSSCSRAILILYSIMLIYSIKYYITSNTTLYGKRYFN